MGLADGLMIPPHKPAVVEKKVSVPHLAVGIWVGTVIVLAAPSMGKQSHRVTEDHLLRAYGIVMTAFALL